MFALVYSFQHAYSPHVYVILKPSPDDAFRDKKMFAQFKGGIVGNKKAANFIRSLRLKPENQGSVTPMGEDLEQPFVEVRSGEVRRKPHQAKVHQYIWSNMCVSC